MGLALQAKPPAFLLVMDNMWAWLDLNQRPHPYQRSTEKRAMLTSIFPGRAAP